MVSHGIFCFPAILWPSWDEAQGPQEDVSWLRGLLHGLAGLLPPSACFLRPIGSRLKHRCTRQQVNSQGLCLIRCSPCGEKHLSHASWKETAPEVEVVVLEIPLNSAHLITPGIYQKGVGLPG